MKGFTLVEVIVVLLLLGMVAAAVVPALPAAATETDASRARDELVSLLAQTRRAALEQGATATLRVNTRSFAWRLTVEGGGNTSTHDGGLSLPPGTVISDADGTLTARFHSDGTVDAEPLALSAGGITKVVSLDRWTGRPR